jgi:predicted PurR-regulated permease PerM
MISPNSKLRIPLTIFAALLLFAASLWMMRLALAPFFAAMVFTYLLWPAHRMLNKRIGKTPSAIIVIFCGLAAAALAIWAVIAVFDDQARRLAALFPQLVETFETKLVPWFQNHPWLIEKMHTAVDSFDPMIFVRGISGAGLGVVGWVLQALTFALVPLIAYYLLVDGPQWLAFLESLVPERFRPEARQVLGEINERLGGFIRGELLVIVSMSFLQGLAFAVLGVPYAWLLGLLAGVANIIPYSPYATALPLALLMAAFEGEGWGQIIAISVTFFVVQKAEGFYFTPVWVGRASRLHPLEVLLALLCFGFAFGVLGLVFAVPLMIVLKVAGKKLLEIYRSHPWFEADSGKGQA